MINAKQIQERYGLLFSLFGWLSMTGLTYDADYVGVVDQDAGVLEASKALQAIQVDSFFLLSFEAFSLASEHAEVFCWTMRRSST